MRSWLEMAVGRVRGGFLNGFRRSGKERGLMLLLAVLLLASCSTTRVLKDGQYRLKRNSITVSNDAHFNAGQLDAYLKQKPDRSLFTYVYNWSTKENSIWHKLGTAPVIYDPDLVDASAANLERHLEYLGWYGSRVEATVSVHKQDVEVHYDVILGKRYKITEIHYALPERGTFAADFLKDTANVTIRPGDWLSEEALEAETVRSSAVLRNMGYYGFNKNYYFFEADTLRNPGEAILEMRVNEYTRNETEKSAVELKRFRFGEVSIYYPKNLKVDERVIRHLNMIRPGMPYGEDVVSNTYSRLSTLNLFSGVNVELNQDGEDRVNCDINLTPARLQGFKLNLEASSNSIGLLGLSPQLSFYHRNIFHGGETLNLSFMGNFQFKPRSDIRSTEFGVSAGVNIPKFLFLPDRLFPRAIPRTEVSASFNYQDRPEYRRHIISFSYGYTGSHRNLYYQIQPAQLSIVRVFNMDENFMETLLANPFMWNAYQEHFILGLGGTFYYTTDASVNPQGDYHYARLQVNTAGHVLGAFKHWMDKDPNGQGMIWNTPYAQFVRAELSVGKTWRFGRNDNQGFATRFLVGIGHAYGNSTALPFEQQFYSGGANSLRAWQARNVGPGNAQADASFVIPNQTGDMKLEANAEYRFPLFWKLNGALFVDAGNVWNLSDDSDEGARFSFSNLGRTVAADWGTGIRVDLNFILVRLDMGFVTLDPSREQRWVGPSGWFRRGGYAIHFGVGYPF